VELLISDTKVKYLVHHKQSEAFLSLSELLERELEERPEYREILKNTLKKFEDDHSWQTFNDMMICKAYDIRLSKIVVNNHLQRKPDLEKVNSILANFNDEMINPLQVHDVDGKFFTVWDGQHTALVLHLLAQLYNEDPIVPTIVQHFKDDDSFVLRPRHLIPQCAELDYKLDWDKVPIDKIKASMVPMSQDPVTSTIWSEWRKSNNFSKLSKVESKALIDNMKVFRLEPDKLRGYLRKVHSDIGQGLSARLIFYYLPAGFQLGFHKDVRTASANFILGENPAPLLFEDEEFPYTEFFFNGFDNKHNVVTTEDRFTFQVAFFNVYYESVYRAMERANLFKVKFSPEEIEDRDKWTQHIAQQ
tara:strand:+ start:602 stop:1684 length:1083 start_codon:yes stop_codon:yes gene_type:complete